MKILGNEIKPGMIIEHKNDLWSVLKAKHVKPGKGGAFNQVELKSIKKKTKKNAFRANLEILRWAKKKINMPSVAIGGINNSNYKKILSNGANFIACSSYVWNNKKLDPVSAIKKFK